MSVIWHDLECGRYTADLECWRALSREAGDPILDVGAGTGRVALDLAARGHRLTALDRDPELLAELARRAEELALELEVVVADAREFDLQARYALCLVPMQTIQLLGGAEGRAAFLRRARGHLTGNGLLAIAIADALECYEPRDGLPLPIPDVCERDGVIYSSQPTAIRLDGDGFVLERQREIIAPGGETAVEQDAIHLDRITPEQLEREAAAVGLRPGGRRLVPATGDYSGSTVVVVRA
jgi:SAM-dependent methyltransferase